MAGSAIALDPNAPLGRCAGCHGDNGVAIEAGTPHLNGQNPDYLSRRIERLHGGCAEVTEHIPPQSTRRDWDAWANYFARQPRQRPPQQTDQALVQRGGARFVARCEGCHPDEGREWDPGKSDYIPRLAGQLRSYLQAELVGYASGARACFPRMDEKIAGLDAEDLKGIAHYLASREASVAPEVKRKRRR